MYTHCIRYGFVIIILNDEFEIRFSDRRECNETSNKNKKHCTKLYCTSLNIPTPGLVKNLLIKKFFFS